MQVNTWHGSDVRGVANGETANSTEMKVKQKDTEDNLACKLLLTVYGSENRMEWVKIPVPLFPSWVTERVTRPLSVL